MFDLALAWAAAHRFAQAMTALYGAAGDLAARIGLSASARRDLKARLESLEALARKLLFLEARKLPTPEFKAATRTGERKHLRVVSEATLGHDARDWRVSFRALPRRAPTNVSAPNPRASARAAARKAFNLHAMARRLEALRRVLENPKAAAARLRLRIHDIVQSAARLLMDNPRDDRCEGENAAANAEIYNAAPRPDSS